MIAYVHNDMPPRHCLSRISTAGLIGLVLLIPSFQAGAEETISGDLPEGAHVRFGAAGFRHSQRVTSVQFSPDGAVLATHSDGGTLWETATGRVLRSLGPKRVLRFSADGRTVLCVGGGVFSLEEVHAGVSVEFDRVFESEDPRGRRLVSVGPGLDTVLFVGGNRADLWDVRNGKRLQSVTGSRGFGACLSESGCRLAVWDGSGDVRILRVPDGVEESRVSLGKTPFWAVSWSPDGAILATTGHARAVSLWDARSGAHIRSAPTGPERFYRPFAFSPDSATLAIAPPDEDAVVLQDARTGVERRRFRTGSAEVSALAFSRDGLTLAVACGSFVRMWETANGRERTQTRAHRCGVRSLAFSPDGRSLASGGDDGTVRLWDVESRRCSAVLEAHAGRVRAVAWSPDGVTLLSAGIEGELRAWNASGGRVIRTIPAGGSLRSATMSPDGTLIAAGRADGHVKVWRAADGELIADFTDRPGALSDPIASISFSHDGRKVGFATWGAGPGGGASHYETELSAPAPRRLFGGFSGGEVIFSPDGTRRCQRLDNGFLLEDLEGEVGDTFVSGEPALCGSLSHLAFSPDGTRIAGLDVSRFAVLDLPGGEIAGSGKDSILFSLAWSPDSRMLATGSFSGDIVLWDVPAPK